MGFQSEQQQQCVSSPERSEEEIDFDDVHLPAQPPAPMAAAAEERRKRAREEDYGHREPDEDKVKRLLTEGLSTLPDKQLTDLNNALSKQHTVKLDNARQIAEMEERTRQGLPPRGFKLPTIHMPAGTEQNQADAKARLLAAFVATYADLIAGRRVVIDLAAAEIQSIMFDRVERQMILVDNIVAGNPGRYSAIAKANIRQLV